MFGDNALRPLLFVVPKHSWWDSVGGGSCQRITAAYVGCRNTGLVRTLSVFELSDSLCALFIVLVPALHNV